MVSEPTIRFAQLQDVPTILSFIKTGAAEQSPGTRVEATEAALVKTLHLSQASSDAKTASEADSAPRFAWALLIVAPDGTTAGLAIYFYNYSTWRAAPGVCLEELFVLSEYRSKGYGKLLIEAVSKEAARAECVKIEWLCFKNNERALRFYQHVGARVMEDWVVLRFDKEKIESLRY
ncbi:N-acetyltransferase ats1 [Xylaria digitata]|nr:N-acetyltransferase ats1 [Xylaria digitata]